MHTDKNRFSVSDYWSLINIFYLLRKKWVYLNWSVFLRSERNKVGLIFFKLMQWSLFSHFNKYFDFNHIYTRVLFLVSFLKKHNILITFADCDIIKLFVVKCFFFLIQYFIRQRYNPLVKYISWRAVLFKRNGFSECRCTHNSVRLRFQVLKIL